MAIERIRSRRSRTVNQTDGVVANRVVVIDTEVDSVKYPSGVGAGKVTGVTIKDADDDEAVELADGNSIVYVETDMAVTRGGYAMVADDEGRVTPAEHVTPEENTEIIGIFEETTPDAGLALLDMTLNGTVRTV